MITLQDVAILLGLSIDGKVVIGSTNLNRHELCQRLLGSSPQEEKHSLKENALLLMIITINKIKYDYKK